MKVKIISCWISLLLFSGLSMAENRPAAKMDSQDSEKTPAWVINKMNEWVGTIHAPMLIKSTITAAGMKGTAEFYFLGKNSDTTWLTLTSFESPTKYGFTVFKKKNAPQEAYFPSLKQRVYRYDILKNPSNVEKFMMNAPTDPCSYDEIASFSEGMSVQKTQTGDYMLSIKVKPDDAMKAFGTKSMIFNVLVNPEGKSLESGMIANDGASVIVSTYTYPQTEINPQDIISKYVTPALSAPLMPNKSFDEADSQAANIAQQKG